jgi:cytochrome c oxidase subunit 2
LNPVPGIQSALHAQSPQAEAIANLTWVLIASAAVITVLVLALLAYALWGPAERRTWLATRKLVVGGGIVFPFLVLTALLIYSFSLETAITGHAASPRLRIAVTGYQWWWRVHYLDPTGALDFVTANEIRIPAGQSVEVLLESADVIHSFSVPNLAGKLDMIPGRTNRLMLQASAPGVFRGQCLEYCGGPHAQMAFYVVAETPEAFELWRAAQRQPAPPAADELTRHGEALFASHCVACHTVRGTNAEGTLGPDLTHVGSRLSIAAGILPNNRGTLASWISASQNVKPGNLMPSMNMFSGAELQALAAYLESLR